MHNSMLRLEHLVYLIAAIPAAMPIADNSWNKINFETDNT